jgi:acyl-coenzyme A synthetase/AMP-(fatty) acid ligase
MLIKEDLSKYDFSSLTHAATAGEALNPEVYKQFYDATGLEIMEGFGQTESTCMIGNLRGAPHKLGSMGLPCPIYDIHLIHQIRILCRAKTFEKWFTDTRRYLVAKKNDQCYSRNCQQERL